jgi:hypothetical protein
MSEESQPQELRKTITIQVRLPEDVAAQLAAEDVNAEELDSFLITAIEAWLRRRQAGKEAQPQSRPWSDIFHDKATDFVDQLIEENQALFEELSHERKTMLARSIS